jgi:hypothetical protein
MNSMIERQRDAGITDAAWWRWFEIMDYCSDPWRDWLRHLRFPSEGPQQS